MLVIDSNEDLFKLKDEKATTEKEEQIKKEFLIECDEDFEEFKSKCFATMRLIYNDLKDSF